MENETQEQTNNRPWLFKKGQSGNPGGRKKGSKSMKTWVREMLEKMTDEERLEFLEGIPKVDIWKLAEGNPDTKNIVGGGSNGTAPILVEFINAEKNNS